MTTAIETETRRVWGVADAHTYRRDRAVTTVYKGVEIAPEYEHRGPRTCVVELRARHDKHRKAYRVSAHLVHYADGWVSEMVGLTEHARRTCVEISATPTARFSAKTLEAVYADAALAFEALPEDDPTRVWATAWLNGEGQ